MFQLIVMAMLLLYPPADHVSLAERLPFAGTSDFAVVRGEVLKHEGRTLILKDSNGREFALRITTATLMPGLSGARFRIGDEVEAQVTKDSQVVMVRPVRQP